MIPLYVVVEQLLLPPNGNIDRHALPAASGQRQGILERISPLVDLSEFHAADTLAVHLALGSVATQNRKLGQRCQVERFQERTS
jgi:hypothetical protein